ncbi:K-box region and MADS-box transcription factor family protein [Striga asiatica]|uniref:K-box region and MADS-box transcription factor family protein n=1 Tax=Striga asiatica TaxID=4170 RepID=A0A5A7RGN9_STRAF|nr:K-box region and MADS-box transcription factor family protein [Striga asiatica]
MRKNLKFFNPSRFRPYLIRPFCSSAHNGKPAATAVNNSNGSSSGNGSSLASYSDQYKALQNLDFMTAAKILFSEPPKKKKFGLDFHLVQLFFVCLPSLAVYLVAQYARSEMRKMDAELEKKKQAEFEKQAKEMELKAAEEKAAAASSPELLAVKERLDKLEVAFNKIVVESKKQSDVKKERENGVELKKALQVEKLDSRNELASKERVVSGDGKTSGLASQEGNK